MNFAKRAPQPTDGSDLGIFAIREMTLLVDVGVNVSGRGLAWSSECDAGHCGREDTAHQRINDQKAGGGVLGTGARAQSPDVEVEDYQDRGARY
ncbi:unnamed protein product, partial [Clonostachys rosea f. rosea IK726]